MTASIYLYHIYVIYFKSHVQCVISFINSGLFCKWACGFKSENSARPPGDADWKWKRHHWQPSLTIRCFLSMTLWRPRWRSFFELMKMLHSVACSLLWQPTLSSDSGVQNKLSVVIFQLPSPFSKWESSSLLVKLSIGITIIQLLQVTRFFYRGISFS